MYDIARLKKGDRNSGPLNSAVLLLLKVIRHSEIRLQDVIKFFAAVEEHKRDHPLI